MRLKVPFLRYVLAVFAFLLPTVVLAAVLPFLINAQPIRAKLLREIGSWTGAEIKVAGAISIQDFFTLSVEALDVEMGQLKGIPPVEGMRAKRIVARVSLSDLLLGSFQFDKIKIYGAVLKVRAGSLEEAPRLYYDLISGERKSFVALHMEDCLVALRTGDRRAYRRLEIGSADAKTSRSGRRLATSAMLRWRDRTATVSVNSRFQIQPAARVPLQVHLASDLLSGDFDGDALLSDTVAAAGELSIHTPDLAKAANWLGIESNMAGVAIGASGQFALSEETATLASGEISLAGQAAQATLTLKRTEALPQLEGTLAFDRLDLKALLTGLGVDHHAFGSIGEFAEADLRLSAKTVVWEGIAAGDTALTLGWRSGQLTTEIAELDFLGGEVRGQIITDIAGLLTHASARLSAEGLDSAALLSLARQRDWLSGSADVNVEAEATWEDPAEIMDRMVARARVNFPEGGQIRLDVPRLAETVPGENDGWGTFEFTSATFDKLRFETTLRDGRLNFTDMLLASAGRQMSGHGAIDLATRSLDWRLTVAPGGAALESGHAPEAEGPDKSVTSRLSIKGPWARPVIRSGEASDSSIGTQPRAAAALELSPSRR